MEKKMAKTRLSLPLGILTMLIVLSVLTGCFKAAAPDVTDTPAGAAPQADQTEEGTPDLMATAKEESARVGPSDRRAWRGQHPYSKATNARAISDPDDGVRHCSAYLYPRTSADDRGANDNDWRDYARGPTRREHVPHRLEIRHYGPGDRCGQRDRQPSHDLRRARVEGPLIFRFGHRATADHRRDDVHSTTR